MRRVKKTNETRRIIGIWLTCDYKDFEQGVVQGEFVLKSAVKLLN